MKVEDFLEAVREGLQAESIQDADRVVRVVVGALKACLLYTSPSPRDS